METLQKTLVAYFCGQDPQNSTVAKVAKELAELTGADLYPILPVAPYSKNEQQCLDQALKELKENARPTMIGPLPILDQYSTIILGFPNWCGTAPKILFSFLDHYYDQGLLKDKHIFPFIINDGSGINRCITDLMETYPNASIIEGSAFIANKFDTAVPLALEWIQTIM